MQLQLKKQKPNQTQQTTEEPPRPGRSSPSAVVPSPAHSPRRGGSCRAPDKMLTSTSQQVGSLITRHLAQNEQGEEGREPARADGATDASSWANLLNSRSYEFLEFK